MQVGSDGPRGIDARQEAAAAGQAAAASPGVLGPADFKLIFVPLPYWKAYYAALGLELPTNTTGSNPTLQLHSPRLTFAPFLLAGAAAEHAATAQVRMAPRGGVASEWLRTDHGGEGDCFFRVLAHAAWGRASMAAAARRLTVTHMARSQSFRARFEPLLGASVYAAEVARLARRGAWVETEVEVAAAAEALGVAIHVRREDVAGRKMRWAAARAPEIYNSNGGGGGALVLRVWVAQVGGTHFVEYRRRTSL